MTAPSGPRLSAPRLLVAIVALLGVEWALVVVGSQIERPPLGSLTALADWLDGADPAALVTAVLQLMSLSLCTYLVAILTFALVAHLVRAPRAAGGLLRAIPAGLRHALMSGTAVATLTAVAPTAALADDASPAQQAGLSGVAVMVKLDGDAVPDSDPGSAPPTTTTSTTITSTTTTPAPTTTTTWTVEPGDSFWSIATAVTHQQASGGEPPTDAEVARYWSSLVQANLDRLAATDNPDVIFTGQELVLPPL